MRPGNLLRCVVVVMAHRLRAAANLSRRRRFSERVQSGVAADTNKSALESVAFGGESV